MNFSLRNEANYIGFTTLVDNKKGNKSRNYLIYTLSAEREGFEPPEPLSSTVFKTAAIDHSAISPVVSNMFCNRFVLNCGAKVRIIFESANF